MYVLFAAPLPWRELRDLVRAMRAALPRGRHGADVLARRPDLALPAPATSPAAGGLLSMPLEDARAAVEHPNGPEVWAALLAEFAAELRRDRTVIAFSDRW